MGWQSPRTVPGAVLVESPWVLMVTFVGAQVGVVILIVAKFVFCAVSTPVAREDRLILRARGFGERLPFPCTATVFPWVYPLMQSNALFLVDWNALRPFWGHVALAMRFLFVGFVLCAQSIRLGLSTAAGDEEQPLAGRLLRFARQGDGTGSVCRPADQAKARQHATVSPCGSPVLARTG